MLKERKTTKEKKPKKVEETKVESPPSEIEGLQQTFKSSEGKMVKLQDRLQEGDYWQTTGRVKRTIITHNGVKKIADIAGVNKVVGYQVLTHPDAMNNYQYTIIATVSSEQHGTANEIGEANRSNLGAKGRGNPANMAQKRAYDRAVFRLLEIDGVLSEEELADEEVEERMDGLSHEERQSISPTVNQLLLASKKEHLIIFNRMMKNKVKEFTEPQLDYLRKLYKKKVAEMTKSF